MAFYLNILVAEHSAMASGCNMKMPPKLEDENSYEMWKNDLLIWNELTDLPANKRALAVHLSLTGRARIASSEIKLEELKSDDGIETLTNKLDALFLADKDRRQFNAFNILYNFRRDSGKEVGAFISEFEHIYYKFTQEEMTLPDALIAFMLLSA